MDSLNCIARVAKGELMPIYIAINGSWVEVNENYTTPHNYDPTDSWYHDSVKVAWFATGCILLPLTTIACCTAGYLLKVMWHNRKKDLEFIQQVIHNARFKPIVINPDPNIFELKKFKPQLSIIIEEDEQPIEEPDDAY